MTRKVILGLNIVLSILMIYFFALYIQDYVSVRNYIDDLKNKGVFKNDEGSYEKIAKIRDYVLKDINTNAETCHFFRYSTRPLWGYRVSGILRNKEGQCGEGTRLLINICSALKVPARRVYLYNNEMNHALIEVFDGDAWVLMDSINSPVGFKEYMNARREGVKDYFNQSKRSWVIPGTGMASFGFYNYSYFNWNKLFNKILRTDVYMHRSLFDNIQGFLENPPLFFGTLILILSLTIDFIWFQFKIRRKHF